MIWLKFKILEKTFFMKNKSFNIESDILNKISFELREISEWKGKIQKCLDQIINQHSI